MADPVDPTNPPAVLTAEWVAGALLSDLGLAAFQAGFCTLVDAAKLVEKYAKQQTASRQKSSRQRSRRQQSQHGGNKGNHSADLQRI